MNRFFCLFFVLCVCVCVCVKMVMTISVVASEEMSCGSVFCNLHHLFVF